MNTENNNINNTEAQQQPAKKTDIVTMHRARKALIICTFTVLVTLILALPFIRPTTSTTEKRELAKFPSFSFSSLFDGSFFKGVGVWFSDTVPGRDILTDASHKLQNLLGTQGVEAGFNEGKTGDDIPETADPDATTEAASSSAAEPTTEVTTAAESTSFVDETDAEFNGVAEQIGGIEVVDNAGYEYYNFVLERADKYIAAINRAGNNLAGKTKVHCMIVPLSSDITMNTKVREKLNMSDQRKATDYMLGSMNQNVSRVEIFNTLKSHRDEYIYFRTDHHWTGLGAYYAYVEYCKSAGISALALEQFTLKSFDNFLGTFYNDSGKNSKLAATPDRVDTYSPQGDVTMVVTHKGTTINYPLIYDESSAPSNLKYGAFIAGDNAFSEITNNSLTNNDVLVVVKESFGNAIVPLLAANYKKVYVIDYRYWSGSITQFCIEKGAKDLLFCNNISMTRSESLISALNSTIG